MKCHLGAIFGSIEPLVRLSGALELYAKDDALNHPVTHAFACGKMAIGIVSDDLAAGAVNPYTIESRFGQLRVMSNPPYPTYWGNPDFNSIIESAKTPNLDKTIATAVTNMGNNLESVIVMAPDRLYIALHSESTTSLFIGEYSHGLVEQSYGFATTREALEAMGMTFWKCLARGDMTIISKQGTSIVRPLWHINGDGLDSSDRHHSAYFENGLVTAIA